jgi:hypothetical protein
MKRFIFVLIVVIGIGLFLYLPPRRTGDRFANHLSNLDTQAAENMLCADSTLRQTLGHFNEGVNQLERVIAELVGSRVSLPGRETLANALQVTDASYNPFNGRYQARFALRGEVTVGGFSFGSDLKTSPMVVIIRREGLIGLCIAAES